MFEATIGKSYAGDIAIDDVEIVPGVCPTPGACTFENNWCGYVNSKTDDFDWLLGSSGTPSGYLGPKTDHTTNLPAGSLDVLLFLFTSDCL